MKTMNGHERNLYNEVKASINANHCQDAVGFISNAMLTLVYHLYSLPDTQEEDMPAWLKSIGDCTADEVYVALENAIEGFPLSTRKVCSVPRSSVL